MHLESCGTTFYWCRNTKKTKLWCFEAKNATFGCMNILHNVWLCPIMATMYYRNKRQGFGGCPSPQPTLQSDKFAYLALILEGTIFCGVIICFSWLIFAQIYLPLHLPRSKLSFEPNIIAKFQFFIDLCQKSYFQQKSKELLSRCRNTLK